MTQTRFEPRALLTVTEAARRLHVSDDTVRRQIREGDLDAVQIGLTPRGRPRYRIPAQVIDERLGHLTSNRSPLQRLREAFAQLSAAEQEDLIAQAVQWAREPQTPRPTSGVTLSADEVRGRVTERGRTLLNVQTGE